MGRDVTALLGTPNWKNETRSDFDDLTAVLPRRYVDLKDHTRLVKGATDLSRPATNNSGGVGPSSVTIPDMTRHAVKGDDEVTHAPRDLRTERQRDLMTSLVNQIGELDVELGIKAMEYTVRKTEAGAWTPGRGGNASDWISRMIAKVRELKAGKTCSNCNTTIRPEWCSVCRTTPAAVATTPSETGNVQHDELIVRETRSGKPMPQYYALRNEDGVVKFYRVKAGTKPGWWWIDAQASGEFHPVRSVGIKNRILRDIIDMGPEASMRLYGQEIGSCGRCHRTLTDETSRANGIGPECEGKL
jgi:hypothetical protein